MVAHGIVKTDMTAPKLFCPDGAVIGHQSRLGFAASRDEVAYALLLLAPEGAEGSTGTIIVVNGEPRTGRRHRVGGIG